ncbi:acireductone synthase [Prosthecobacter sp.]|uniref:acireductone synthase n=1 Tax=Prosthecobacter sp. TaxID=1965333 RepID=UPI003784AF0C
MITFGGKLILLDIEGTVSPLAFVHDMMFPYARQRVDAFLSANWDDAGVQAALKQMAQDGGSRWENVQDLQPFVVAEVHRLMDADVKATGLKLLQGLIWEEGFRTGELRSRIFEDVPHALAQWCRKGCDIRIYSSGSVHAQKLFFAHTQRGDLSVHLSGCYDTTTGSKREASSYASIAADCRLRANHILFVSDVADELDAARTAGMFTALAIRPGNRSAPPHDHPVIHSFSEIEIA